MVLVSGDEEYRSEEALPQLAKILAKHHGFDCTVLFAVDDEGVITPPAPTTSPAWRRSKTADLMVILTRFRDLPDDEMKQIADYVDSGRPIVGMRTATHAFNLKPEQGLRPLLVDEQGVGRRLRPAGAGRDVDRPPRPPRQAEHPRHHRAGGSRGTRSCAASRTATSGARPTSIAFACRCPATASRWSWARCSRG